MRHRLDSIIAAFLGSLFATCCHSHAQEPRLIASNDFTDGVQGWSEHLSGVGDGGWAAAGGDSNGDTELNDAGCSLSAPQPGVVAGYENRRFLVADVDRDGRADLIMTRAEYGRVEAIYFLATATGFQPGKRAFQQSGPYDYSNREFLAADVNADGRADLIMTRAEYGRVEAAYFLAHATGFNPGMQIFQQGGPYDYSNRKFLAADLNADRRADLIMTRAEYGRVEAAYFLANATGFDPGLQIFQQGGPYDYSNRKFLAADLNADRRADLIMTRAEYGRVEAAYFLANATGFDPGLQIFQQGGPYDYSNRKFLAADLNADRRADLIMTRAEYGRVEAVYFLANATGFDPGLQIFQQGGPYDYSNRKFLAADINADRRADLIMTRAEYGRVEAAYFLANATGFDPGLQIFQIFQQGGPYDYSNRKFLAADLNADSRADLIMTRAEYGRVEASYFLATAAGFAPGQQIFQWGTARDR